jgi:phage shock protein A
MSILSKIFTALKGGAREVGESIVDANGIRIFEQEIADAKNAQESAKKNLTKVMAEEMQTKRKIADLENSIAEHEGFAGQALEKGDEAMALEIADKIAQFENEKTDLDEVLTTYSTSVAALKQQVKEADKTIKENQRQLSMVKTTESVQKATMAVNTTLASNNSSMSSAKASLERIKQRQADRNDQLAAAKTLDDEENGTDLKARMAAAGIGDTKSNSSDILARIKAKKG